MIAPLAKSVQPRGICTRKGSCAPQLPLCFIIINHPHFFLVPSINESNDRGDFVVSTGYLGTF